MTIIDLIAILLFFIVTIAIYVAVFQLIIDMVRTETDRHRCKGDEVFW